MIALCLCFLFVRDFEDPLEDKVRITGDRCSWRVPDNHLEGLFFPLPASRDVIEEIEAASRSRSAVDSRRHQVDYILHSL